MILEIINTMNEVKIELEFKDKPTRLYGDITGENIYILAVEDKIDWNGKNIIIFPEYIENISISFVKGFTKKIFDNINKEESTIYIDSSDDLDLYEWEEYTTENELITKGKIYSIQEFCRSINKDCNKCIYERIDCIPNHLENVSNIHSKGVKERIDKCYQILLKKKGGGKVFFWKIKK